MTERSVRIVGVFARAFVTAKPVARSVILLLRHAIVTRTGRDDGVAAESARSSAAR